MKIDLNLKEIVYKYPTKYGSGFVQSEIDELVDNIPEINIDKFNAAMTGNTGQVIEGEFISYRGDVLKALICGIENRNLTTQEWD